MLVIPRRHCRGLFDLDADEYAAIWRLVRDVRHALYERLQPDGFNVGANDGTAAGQTVPHAHVHVIPRFDGDVPDPRGGLRWVVPDRAAYWEGTDP
jgi:diadenosine tetraphosphate (Ap4A) HIT family hydrolase